MSESVADKEWEELIDQLRTQPLAQPRPFFYHRVQARLTPGASRPWLSGWVRRPAYALLLSVLVVALSGGDTPLASGATPAATHLPAPR